MKNLYCITNAINFLKQARETMLCQSIIGKAERKALRQWQNSINQETNPDVKPKKAPAESRFLLSVFVV